MKIETYLQVTVLTGDSVRVGEVDHLGVLVQGLPDLLHVTVPDLDQELVPHRRWGCIGRRLKGQGHL